MQIKLKKLTLTNFKGIKSLNVEFGRTTDIYGDNATGKTTVFDAFCWLLFGKDSLDRKDFNVKTLSVTGEPLHYLDHAVKGVIERDDQSIALERVMREKWVKKRGEAVAEFTGHETVFFINGAPAQAGEYARFVSEILPENLFKMITSPYYFNSMKWQDRRAALISMAGDITDEAIAHGRQDFQALLSHGKELGAWRREIAAHKKTLTEELKAIPPRMDEVDRSMPAAVDMVGLSDELQSLSASIKEVEGQMESQSERHREASRAQEQSFSKLRQLKQSASVIEYAHREATEKAGRAHKAEIVHREQEVKELNTIISQLERDLGGLQARHTGLVEKKDRLAEQWEARNAEDIGPEDLNCGACGAPLSGESAGERKLDFNTKKIKDLQAITNEGLQVRSAIDDTLNAMEGHRREIDEYRASLSIATELLEQARSAQVATPPTVSDLLATDQQYQQTLSQITVMETELAGGAPEPDLSDLKKQRATLQQQVEEIKRAMATGEQRAKLMERIAQLQAKERELSQQVADLERTEFTMDAFTKAKMEAVEKRINSKFRLVTFKMYNRLINGGEEETCEALIDGVPFSDANHAAQVNAGIDIVNAFSTYSGVVAPVFIDNAEAITRLTHTPSQLIRLVVSPTDHTLRVEQPHKEVAIA